MRPEEQHKIVMYSTTPCPYCVSAKRLLQTRGLEFVEINLVNQPEEMVALKDRTGWRTVPQIFINGQLIGGYTDLATLNESGELDKLLAQS
jgi:glutaredoxin 3